LIQELFKHTHTHTRDCAVFGGVTGFLLFQMTGLDIEKDRIIEMACIVTDSDLNIIAEVGDSLLLVKYAERPGPCSVSDTNMMFCISRLIFGFEVIYILVYTFFTPIKGVVHF